MDVVQHDGRYLAREAAQIVQFARSESCFLFDQRRKKYVDFTASWCLDDRMRGGAGGAGYSGGCLCGGED
jgi:hypothetical protein